MAQSSASGSWALGFTGGEGTQLHPVTPLAAAHDRTALTAVYRDLAPWNFRRDLLPHVTPHLAAGRTNGLGWSDWGPIDAIERTLATLGWTPP